MDWKQELLKRLDAVASKLGTTTEYLWRVLVKQGYVEAIATLCIIPVLLLCAYGCYVFVKKIWAVGVKDDWDSPGPRFGVVFGIVGSIILVVVSACNAYYGVIQLLNPEYFALQQILQGIK